MKLRRKLAGILAGAAGCLALATTAAAQVSADALLDKLVAKGILTTNEAAQLKDEEVTNNASQGMKFKLSGAIKSMELFGDLRMRYEYRSAQLGPEAGKFNGESDSADRWRYALRLGVRGDLADDFYYGIRLETSQNERSTWNTFGSTGTSPTVGPFSKSSYSLYIGEAYLGWRPAPWLDMSIGRVAQPFYTTPMVWDSDYTPEGAVEKLKFTSGPLDIFANFGQFVYQDVTPTSAAAIEGGQNSGVLVGDWSDNNAYMMAWQVGFNYRVDPKLSVKLAPVYYNYIGHGNQSAGFYGPFVGQGIGGFTFNTNTPGNLATTAGSVPGGTAGTNTSFLSPSSAGNSYNQTGINNLSILELPMEINFKIASLDARAFGDYAINLAGNKRAFTAYNTGEAIASQTGNPNPFPHGAQYNQDQAMQFGLAVGNNLDLVYGAKPKKGTWEARVYWQHVEQYALDPNLLDSDFFEGRGNLQGVYVALAYSFSDAIIGTIRYGEAERIDKALGTGGYNADLPLPNPINRFQILQVDATWKF